MAEGGSYLSSDTERVVERQRTHANDASSISEGVKQKLVSLRGEPQSGTTVTTEVIRTLLLHAPNAIVRGSLANEAGMQAFNADEKGMMAPVSLRVTSTHKHSLPGSVYKMRNFGEIPNTLEQCMSAAQYAQNARQMRCVKRWINFEHFDQLYEPNILLVRDPREQLLARHAKGKLPGFSSYPIVGLDKNDVMQRYCVTAIRRLQLRYIWHTRVMNNSITVSYMNLVKWRIGKTTSELCHVLQLPKQYCDNRRAMAFVVYSNTKSKMAKAWKHGDVDYQFPRKRINGKHLSNRKAQLDESTNLYCWNQMRDRLAPDLMQLFQK